MKLKKAALIIATVIIMVMFIETVAEALSTSYTIHLTVRVISAISLNLENGWMQNELSKPQAEAFSELKERSVIVDKLERGDATVWLFTKTE